MFLAGLGASSIDELRAVALTRGTYWLVFAVLQVLWRRQGREYFWRPAYPTVLFLLLVILLLPFWP